MKKPKVTVSLVTWNNSKTIKDCILSIIEQSFENFEIFIVDNDSKDNTLEVIKAISDERIHIFEFAKNSGFCGGHNFIISQTSSPFILLINPDIILRKDYIENAINRMENDYTIGTVCGLLMQKSLGEVNNKIDSAGLIFNKDRRLSLRYHGKELDNLNLEAKEVFGTDGALPLFRRSMVDDLLINGKFFDEMFFAHKEDWDVAWRAQIFGWKTIFDPKCMAVHPRHFKPGNLKLRVKIKDKIKYHGVKNQLMLIIKNEDFSLLFYDFWAIMYRQILVFIYIIFFERSSLSAYTFVIKNIHKILEQRREIQERRKVTIKKALNKLRCVNAKK